MGIRTSKLKTENDDKTTPNNKTTASEHQDKYKDDLEDAVNLVMSMQGERNTINIELSIACQDLPNADFFSLSDPITHVFLEKNDEWVRVGSTEPIFDTLNPIFTEKVLIPFNAQQKQRIKFEVYDIDKLEEKDLLHKSTKLGYVESELSEIIYKDVWESPLKSDNRRYKGGIIKIQAIESDIGQSKIWFTFELHEFLTTHNILFTISGANNSNQFFSLYKSKPQKNTAKGCFFEPFRMTSNQINNESSNLKFEFYEFKNGKAASFLGELNISLLGLYNAKGNFIEVFKNNLVVGKMKISSVDRDNNDSFFNYIYAGYTVKTVFGLDLSITKSNEETHLNNKDFIQIIEELNIRKPNTNRERIFEVYFDPIIKLTTIMNYFNDVSQIPVYGIGAKLPPLHDIDCNLFSLTENVFNPFFETSDDLIDALKTNVIDNQKFKSSNVSFYKEIANFCNGLAKSAKEREEKTYIVCLILTNHYPNDVNQFLQEIKAAHNLPISFVMCNVHTFEDLKLGISKTGPNYALHAKREDKYEWIASELKREKFRENFYWFKCKNFEEDIESLARNVLCLLPFQFCEYMKMNDIRPKGGDKKSNKTRNRGIKKELINMLEARKTKKSENNIIKIYLNNRKANLIRHLKDINFDKRFLSFVESKNFNVKLPSENINVINQVLTHIEFYDKHANEQPILIEELQYEYASDKNQGSNYIPTRGSDHQNGTNDSFIMPHRKRSTVASKFQPSSFNRRDTKKSFNRLSNLQNVEDSTNKTRAHKISLNIQKNTPANSQSPFHRTEDVKPLHLRLNNPSNVDHSICNSSLHKLPAIRSRNTSLSINNLNTVFKTPKDPRDLVTEKVIFEKTCRKNNTSTSEVKSECNSKFLEELETRQLKFLKDSLPNTFYQSIENSFIKNKKKTLNDQTAKLRKVSTPLDKYFMPKRLGERLNDSNTPSECLYCHVNAINIIFMNCGHAMYCDSCYMTYYKSEKCEVCKLPIETVYRTEITKRNSKISEGLFGTVENDENPGYLPFISEDLAIDRQTPEERNVPETPLRQKSDDYVDENNLTNEPDDSFTSFDDSKVSIIFEDGIEEERAISADNL